MRAKVIAAAVLIGASVATAAPASACEPWDCNNVNPSPGPAGWVYGWYYGPGWYGGRWWNGGYWYNNW